MGLYKTLPFVHNPAYDEAFFCRLHSESSVTCQALLASKDAQRAINPHFVSPMFKGMESQSAHVIKIIKNGYNPTENSEPIFWHQPSRSFGVSLAFSNLVFALHLLFQLMLSSQNTEPGDISDATNTVCEATAEQTLLRRTLQEVNIRGKQYDSHHSSMVPDSSRLETNSCCA